MDNKLKWKDKSILDSKDVDELDASAAVHEFRGGLTQADAEQRAHNDYLKNHAIDSAAHHYLGVRAALAANNQGAAKRHGQGYAAAMSYLGLDATGQPTKEVLDRTKDTESNPYSFKAHKADDFFTPQQEEKKPTEQERTQELLDKIRALKVVEPLKA